jgi:hypothetical protein
MFGNGCVQMDRDKVKDILKVGVEATDEKYLGLPTPKEGSQKTNSSQLNKGWS